MHRSFACFHPAPQDERLHSESQPSVPQVTRNKIKLAARSVPTTMTDPQYPLSNLPVATLLKRSYSWTLRDGDDTRSGAA